MTNENKIDLIFSNDFDIRLTFGLSINIIWILKSNLSEYMYKVKGWSYGQKVYQDNINIS